MRIAYLGPVPESAAEGSLEIELNKNKSPGTEVSYHTLISGADNFEYHIYEAFMIPQILKKIKSLEDAGYDAVILGCFYDPGLDAAKEYANDIIVVGVAESSIALTRFLCKRFSLLIPRDKNYTHMIEMVEKYEAMRFLASIRTLHIRVLDLQEESKTVLRMKQEIDAAIKNDKAEAIILACTMESGKFRELQEQFEIPVIDPTIAALKMAEYLVNCKKQCGWKVSKVGSYESPPEDEMILYDF